MRDPAFQLAVLSLVIALLSILVGIIERALMRVKMKALCDKLQKELNELRGER